MNVISAPNAIEGFAPVMLATGERITVNGYAVGTRTKSRRVALIRAIIQRASDLGAEFPRETWDGIMHDDDFADTFAARYTGRVTGLTLSQGEDTWDFTHDFGGGGSRPVAHLVVIR